MIKLHFSWFVIWEQVSRSTVEKSMNLPHLPFYFGAPITIGICKPDPFVASIFHNDNLTQNAFRHLHCTAPASHAHKGAASV